MRGRALMVQGCSSSAGKSYLAAALCRIYARRGVAVAPFKAQNMSNNAGVTPEGLELGRAQLVQARAARVSPQARMNPVLIKPEGDTRSQVVVLGKRDAEVTALPWNERKDRLWPVVQASLKSLLHDFELVVIEGAGSPAEVNLKAGDIVNMRVAREAGARVLLAADIDRGGAFAHLLGTWACLSAGEQALLEGFVLNKFRGDPALLADGTAWLEAHTRVPTVGVVPYLPLALPEEDAHTLATGPSTGTDADTDALKVAVIRFPALSNFDEFGALASEPGVSLCWAETPEVLADASLIILPGSKYVASDGAWLTRTGLAEATMRRAASGVQVLGVCGGLQLLGHCVSDPHGVEGGDEVRGLGLLDLETTLEPTKVTRLTRATLAATGEEVEGYELHHGRSRAGSGARPYLMDDLGNTLGFQQGNVTGVYPHGLFESTAFRRHLLGTLGVKSSEKDAGAQLEADLERLADHVEAHLEGAVIDGAWRTHTTGRASTPTQASHLTLITGGARSGKSHYAEALVKRSLKPDETALYLATLSADDPEMVRRTAQHRARRPEAWRTLETPLAPAAALAESPERVVLLDCLSGFVANVLLAKEAEGAEAATEAIIEAVDALIETVRGGHKTVVVVTNEVGSGVVPAYALGRLYRDALGLANARVAAAADAAVLCVAGLPQPLKGMLPEVSLE